jgi:ribonuclease P protein component
MTEQNVRLSFSKKNRLCSTRLIEQLYNNPSVNDYLFPFKVSCIYTLLPEDVPAQILISVSSRKFKRAHDRNRIKRQIREIIRLQLPLIHKKLEERKQQVAIIVTFVGKEHLSYSFMQEKLNHLMLRLVERHENITE